MSAMRVESIAVGGAEVVDPSPISIADQLSVLWRVRWRILFVTLLGAVIGGVAAWVVPDKYLASVLLAPAPSIDEGGGLGGLSGLMSQFGDLPALAGLSLGGESSKKAEAVAMLQSEALTSRYIKEQQLLPLLYPRRWNEVSGTWNTRFWQIEPTIWRGVQKFKSKVRSVSSNTKTGLVTLNVRWTDPELAARWANDLVALTNKVMKTRALEESEQRVAYLSDAEEKAKTVEARQAIYAVMRSEVNRSMLAKGTEEYAFRVIDPAVVAEKPDSPNKIVWTLVGALMGAIAVCVAALIRQPQSE